jgi:hypothetical protein
MSVTLNLNQAAAAILLQQFNADNGTAFTTEQVTFGPVMENNDVDADVYEAAVTMTGVPGSGVYGTFVYKYNRIDLSTIFTSKSFDVTAITNYQGLITAINAALSTAMQLSVLPNNDSNQLYVAGDISPAAVPYPPAGKTSVNFLLTADPNSLIYRNSVMLTATTTAVSIAAKATTPSTGLNFPPAT